MSATTTYVGVSASPVAKRLYWASEDADGIWRGEGSSGRWRKPEDFGERSVLPPNKIVIEAHETPDLRARFALREKLAKDQHRFLLMGIGSPGPDKVSRNQKTLLEGKRAFFTADVEKLLLAEDVVDSDNEIPDLLFAKFEACGLDWLNGDFVLHLSSSHGLRDAGELRAHIEWQPTEPMTLAEMKRVAAYINRKLGGDYVDVKIYESSRFLFTSPAELIYRYWQEGKGYLTRPMPPLPVTPVRYVDRDAPTITIPPEALRGAPIAIPDLKRPTTAKAIGKLVAGNVHNYMVRRAFAVVKGTPWHRLGQAKEQLRQELAAGVMALDDPEKLEARLAHVTGAAFEASWAGALTKRYPWGDWYSHPLVPREPASSPEVAREVLKAIVEQAVAAGLGETSLEPVHTLVPAPPGLGKSEAALIALTTARATVNRLSVLSPTVPLSEELAKRHPLTNSPNKWLKGLVRHHKGRRHYCDMPAFDRLARQLEKIGRSPLKPVCGHCPKRDACPWPAQQADTGAGIIFGQHAHATTSMRRTKAGTEGAQNFTIVDEAPTDTLLAPNKWPRHIAALRRINRQVRILSSRGLVHDYRTADLVAYRKEIIDALDKNPGKLKFDLVAPWARIINIRPATDTKPAWDGPIVDAAIEAERQCRMQYDKQLAAAMADKHERTAAGSSDLSPRRQVQAAIRHLEASAFFCELYRAIKAAFAVNAARKEAKEIERDYVAGVFSFAKSVYPCTSGANSLTSSPVATGCGSMGLQIQTSGAASSALTRRAPTICG